MIALGILSFLLLGPPDEVPLERLGRLEHPAIREASGIVKSRRHPGIFWVHNDSGNPPALFAVRRDGSLVREYKVSVPNVDWEDIATDDHGHLFIGEIGNNNALLPLRAVYQLDEPDPLRKSNDDDGFLKVKTASYYRFPPSGRFDAEGLVIDGDRALIVSKTFDGRPAEVYAVPLNPPAPLIRPAVAERVGTLTGFTEAVTGAHLSPDGRRLVVCSLASVGVYQKAPKDEWKLLARKSFRSGDQVEAVAWNGDDVILAGEGRGVFRIKAGTWRGRLSSSPNLRRHDD
jgi:hypothetical protein